MNRKGYFAVAGAGGVGDWAYQSAPTNAGTSFDFTGIPVGVSEIELHFNLVSLNGANDLLVQLGTTGGIEPSGYSSGSGNRADIGGERSSTSGFVVHRNNVSGYPVTGAMRIIDVLGTGLTWSSTHTCSVQGTPARVYTVGSGNKTLSAVLDRVRLTRTGSNTFNGGAIYVRYR